MKANLIAILILASSLVYGIDKSDMTVAANAIMISKNLSSISGNVEEIKKLKKRVQSLEATLVENTSFLDLQDLMNEQGVKVMLDVYSPSGVTESHLKIMTPALMACFSKVIELGRRFDLNKVSIFAKYGASKPFYVSGKTFRVNVALTGAMTAQNCFNNVTQATSKN